MKRLLILMLSVATAFSCGSTNSSESNTSGDESNAPKGNPVVVFETNMGSFEVELYPDKAPVSVENFLGYVKEGFYDGLIFHRVIDGFMIQGGGMDENMKLMQTREPIKNEAGNGLTNDEYTIAMARTNVINSTTSQFFINVKDNAFLNHRDETPQGYGYAVFGKVISGFETVDKIKGVQTTTKAGHQNVPVHLVVIKKAYVKK